GTAVVWLSVLVTARSEVGFNVSMVSKWTGWRLAKVHCPWKPCAGSKVALSMGLVVPARLPSRGSPGPAGGVGLLPWMVKGIVALGVTWKVSLPLPPLTVVPWMPE